MHVGIVQTKTNQKTGTKKQKATKKIEAFHFEYYSHN